MYNPFTLKGKTILVTGGSSGIGRATAIECSRMGANVVVVGRDVQRLNETMSQLDGSGHGAHQCDLTQPDEVEQLVGLLPPLQGVVLNAGIDKKMAVRYLKQADLQSLFDTNTTAPIMLLQQLLKHKRVDRGASVVFTSSISAVGAAAVGNAAYAATKGALCSYARVAALELSGKGIRVNTVCPGMVRTPMNEVLLVDGQDEQRTASYPLKRLGNPTDVAWAMVYLLSDAASWVTGTNLVIDGGLTLC